MYDEAFYSTAAQVIPILILALVFERRYFEARDDPAWVDLFLLSVLIALVGGEYFALAAVKADEPPGPFTEVLVAVALAWGGLALFVPLFRDRLRNLGQTLPGWVVRTARVAWVPLLLIVMALATFVDVDVLPGAIAALVLAALVGGWVAGLRVGFGTTDDDSTGSKRVPDAVREEGASGTTERE